MESAARMKRILSIIPFIRKNPGVSAKDLALMAKCQPSEIMSDLDRIMMCGVPPYLPNDYIAVWMQGDRVELKFADHFKRPISLTLSEAVSLQTVLMALPATSDTEQENAVRQLAKKIEQVLPSETRREMRSASQRFHLDNRPTAIDKKTSLIEKAIRQRCEIRMSYFTASRDEMTERTARPYAIFQHSGNWYLVAHCNLRERELPFRVDRIRDIELLDENTFDMPKEFKLDKYRSPEMYQTEAGDFPVQIKFDRQIARWIEEQASAEILERTPEGDLIMTIRTSRPMAIVRWIIQYGNRAEVISPDTLRREMRRACDRILMHYK